MALTSLQVATLVERYKRERDRFEKLAAIVSRRLSSRLRAAAIPHVPTFRSKDPDSLGKKLAREADAHDFKKFERDFSPSVKDLAGVRVILYRPRDVEPACTIVEELFLVPQPEEFRKDHVNEDGYRARHLMQLFPDQGIARFRLNDQATRANNDPVVSGAALGALVGAAVSSASKAKEGLLGGLVVGMLVGGLVGAQKPVERVLALRFDQPTGSWQVYDGPLLRWAKRTLYPATPPAA